MSSVDPQLGGITAELRGKWLISISSYGLRPRTIEAYDKETRSFLDWILSKAVSYDRVDLEHLEGWMAWQREKGNKMRSIQVRVSMVKQWYKWMLAHHYIAENPFDRLGKIKAPKLKPRPLTEDTVSRILDHPMGLRDKAIMELLYSSGCRVSEVVNLYIENIDFQEGAFKIMGKGGEIEEGLMTPGAARALQAYIESRGNPSQGRVFMGKRGPITDEAVRYRLKKTLKALGLPDSIYVHQLRHSTATHLYRRTRDLLFVSKVLRHKRVETTQGYADLCRDDLKHTFLDAHPRA